MIGVAVRAAVLVAVLVVSGTGGAEAHRLKAFATVEGQTINGSVYFAGMGAARAADVKLLAPDGSLVAETTTDDEGRFTVTVPQIADYRIVSDTGDGHRAEFLVQAREFLNSHPAASPGPAPSLPAVAGADRAPAGSASAPELEAVVDRVVARHIGLLREQLDASESQLRLRDIVGGLGWIAGMTGVVCWVASRHGRSRQ